MHSIIIAFVIKLPIYFAKPNRSETEESARQIKVEFHRYFHIVQLSGVYLAELSHPWGEWWCWAAAAEDDHRSILLENLNWLNNWTLNFSNNRFTVVRLKCSETIKISIYIHIHSYTVLICINIKVFIYFFCKRKKSIMQWNSGLFSNLSRGSTWRESSMDALVFIFLFYFSYFFTILWIQMNGCQCRAADAIPLNVIGQNERMSIS